MSRFKLRMPHLPKLSWATTFEPLLLNCLATIIGIALTFGVDAHMKNKERARAHHQLMVMVGNNMNESLIQMEDLRALLKQQYRVVQTLDMEAEAFDGNFAFSAMDSMILMQKIFCFRASNFVTDNSILWMVKSGNIELTNTTEDVSLLRIIGQMYSIQDQINELANRLESIRHELSMELAERLNGEEGRKYSLEAHVYRLNSYRVYSDALYETLMLMNQLVPFYRYELKLFFDVAGLGNENIDEYFNYASGEKKDSVRYLMENNHYVDSIWADLRDMGYHNNPYTKQRLMELGWDTIPQQQP